MRRKRIDERANFLSRVINGAREKLACTSDFQSRRLETPFSGVAARIITESETQRIIAAGR